MSVDKEWLDIATIKELEDENDELSQEIDSIAHQIEMAMIDKKTLDKGWLAKAKFARQCKIADREIVRREMSRKKKDRNINKSKNRNDQLLKFIRQEIGLARFYEIVERFNEPS